MNLFFCGGISQKLVCMLCRLKRYNLIHHESQGERGIIRFPLVMSVKYVFSEATEGFVGGGSICSVSYVEMEVWSVCDIFTQRW